MYRPRLVEAKLKRLIECFPAVVVTGARQVGKTTLVRRMCSNWDYVVFDPALDLEQARAEPELFLRNHPGPLVLDEIQFAPEIVAAVKRRIDAKDAVPGQFVLTGSQQWQVMRSLAESLAGRAVSIDLEGFSYIESIGRGAEGGWLGRWLADAEALVAAPSCVRSNAHAGSRKM